MFGSQAMRLLRKRWANASELSEELFAMLNDLVPLEHRGPITLTMGPDSTEPAITIRNLNGDIPSIRFTRTADDIPTGSINADGDLLDEEGEPKSTPATPSSGGGSSTPSDSSVYSGSVVSGTGDTYICTLYSDAWTTPILQGSDPKEFTVKVGQIGATETLPAGTKLVVGLRGTQYFGQPAVWY